MTADHVHLIKRVRSYLWMTPTYRQGLTCGAEIYWATLFTKDRKRVTCPDCLATMKRKRKDVTR